MCGGSHFLRQCHGRKPLLQSRIDTFRRFRWNPVSGVEIDDGGVGAELARLCFLDVWHPEGVLGAITAKEDWLLDLVILERNLCRACSSVIK